MSEVKEAPTRSTLSLLFIVCFSLSFPWLIDFMHRLCGEEFSQHGYHMRTGALTGLKLTV